MSSLQIPTPELRDAVRKEIRVFWDFLEFLLQNRNLRDLPQGRGEPVLVLPGYWASDKSTWILRRFLNRLGYHALGWGLGKNRGNVEELSKVLTERLETLWRERGQKTRLVGWSLGGYMAREIARDRPDLVHSVVSLGSPIFGGAKYTVVARRFRDRGEVLDAMERLIAKRAELPIGVPLLSIYSKNDGIVAWQASLDEDPRHRVEHAEVTCSHLGFGFHVGTFRLLAEFLRK